MARARTRTRSSSPSPRPSRARAFLFAACLLPILGALAVHATRGPIPERTLEMEIALGVGAASWLLAVWLAARGHADLRLVVAGAICLRLLALAGPPSLSDDVYRYVFEGELLADGQSPYLAPPDSAAHEAYRERLPEVYEHINNEGVSAAYPPLAQFVHAGIALAAHPGGTRPGTRGVDAMRLFYGVCDLLVLLPLVVLLRRARRPTGLAVVWGWSPLVALEFAGSGHLDSLGILLMLSSFVVLRLEDGVHGAQNRFMGSVLLAGAILTKYLPLVAVPFAVRGRGWWKGTLWIALFCAMAFVPFFLLPGEGAGLTAGLSEYGLRWEGGSLVFRWIDRFSRAFLHRDYDPRKIPRVLVAVAFLLCFLYAWRKRWDLVRATGFLLAAFLLLTPTLHPWYLCWILPMLALRTSLAWYWVVAAAPLLYWPLAGWRASGSWDEPIWLWPAIAGPFALLLLVDRLRGRRSASQPALAAAEVAPS